MANEIIDSLRVSGTLFECKIPDDILKHVEQKLSRMAQNGVTGERIYNQRIFLTLNHGYVKNNILYIRLFPNLVDPQNLQGKSYVKAALDEILSPYHAGSPHNPVTNGQDSST